MKGTTVWPFVSVRARLQGNQKLFGSDKTLTAREKGTVVSLIETPNKKA